MCCWTGRPSPANGGGCSAAAAGRPWCCRSGGTATATASARCAPPPPQCGVLIEAACRIRQLKPRQHMRRVQSVLLRLMHSTHRKLLACAPLLFWCGSKTAP